MWCVAHERYARRKAQRALTVSKVAWKTSPNCLCMKRMNRNNHVKNCHVPRLFVTGFLFLTLHPAFSPTERSRVSSVCTLRRKVDRIRRPVVLQVSWMGWRRCLLAQRSSQQMVRCWLCRIQLLCGTEPVVQEMVYFLPVRKLRK